MFTCLTTPVKYCLGAGAAAAEDPPTEALPPAELALRASDMLLEREQRKRPGQEQAMSWVELFYKGLNQRNEKENLEKESS